MFSKRSIIAIALTGLLSACTSSPRPEVMIHESPRGAVYLEPIADRAVQATHPISLDEGLITRMFRGVLVVADRTTLQSLFGSEAKTARAFSDEDAAFVAPQVAKAFLQARPDQQVGFRLLYAVSPISYPAGGGAAVGSTAPLPTSPQTQTTVGALYVNGLSVHLTLKEFQYRPTSADTIGGPNRYYPDRTGFDSREIAFVPSTAERPDVYKSKGLFGQPQSKTVVIDYQLLAKLPVGLTPGFAPVSMSEASAQLQAKEEAAALVASPPAKSAEKAPSDSEEVQLLKDLVIKKDMELEALKKELRNTQRQLSEREAELQNQTKRKGKPTPKAPE